MSQIQLDYEQTTPDLTSYTTILTDIPSTTLNKDVVFFVEFTGLDGTGGLFEFTITIDGATVQPSPIMAHFGTEVNSCIGRRLGSHYVPLNQEIILKCKSPNAGDSSGVTVDSYLFDTSAGGALIDYWESTGVGRGLPGSERV